MVGLEVPQGSRNLEVKPYAVSSVQSDLTSVPRVRNDPSADVGVDVRYGLTQNMSADFTYNTDFAQVEADEQQINLTRFSLFFPEKREFFLENQGLFGFGGVASNCGQRRAGPVLQPAHRVRSGVRDPDRGRRAGDRTGGPLQHGPAEHHIERRPSVLGVGRTNFSVARFRRDILAPQQHRRHRHQPVADTDGRGQQPGLWR